jgi:hypothetical protein
VVFPGSPSLVEVLRSTLKRLEQNEDLAADDPALAELKGSILRTITELEVGKTPKSSAQQRILWITPRPRAVELDPGLGHDETAEDEDLAANTLAAPAAKANARKSRNRAASTRRVR